MSNPFSTLKDRPCIYLREALDILLSAELVPTDDPAYRMIRDLWKGKLKIAISTGQLAGFDIKDTAHAAVKFTSYWLTVPDENRYQITGDLEVWYKAEKLKEARAGIFT